jgi:hypothetical protein
MRVKDGRLRGAMTSASRSYTALRARPTEAGPRRTLTAFGGCAVSRPDRYWRCERFRDPQMLRSSRITTHTASLPLGLPSRRRMPPPSRLPEIDIEAVATLTAASSRSRTGSSLRAVLAALVGAVRR